ncbi:DUF6928 family protein [Rhodococcus zopfii]|uniref:DUF6928 family protein n=1 Tax=Rhodococcus zopfii TaxID=43772 RepID=UPI0011111613|nr:hypothetical protein [Rhodococcus zopfii]
MAASVSTLWYVDAPEPAAVLRSAHPARDSAQALVGRLYPHLNSVPLERVPLAEAVACAEPDRVHVGSYPGVTVVCSPDLPQRRPSSIPETWTHTLGSEYTYLIRSDPPRAWGAFAQWHHGELRRAFSATTVDIFEDQGVPYVWERPFWAGDHPVRWPVDIPPPPQALPFHPRRLVETANDAWLGFRYIGGDPGGLTPAGIEVWRFGLYRDGEIPPGTSDPAPPRERRGRRWWHRTR